MIQERIFTNMNQLIMVRGRTGKITVSPSRTEAVVCNRCEYQFPEIVGSDISTNNNCIFHISTVNVVSIVVGDCIKKIGSLCAYFLIWYPWWKPRWKMVWLGFSIYEARPLMYQTNQYSPYNIQVFMMKKVKNQHKWPAHITPEAIRSFLSFVMIVQIDQADP